MKKIIFVIFMLILPCMFITGCLDENEPPTLIGTSVNVVNLDYEFDSHSNVILISLSDISSINFVKEDFNVVEKYSNNTTKTISRDEYKISLTVPLSSMKPNSSYKLNFISIDEEKIIAYVNIKTDYIYIAPLTLQENITMKYTGEELNIIDKLDSIQPASNKKVSELISEGALVIDHTSTYLAKSYKAQGYKLSLILSNGYKWANGNTNKLTIDWNIERVRIPIPQIDTELIYQYEMVNGEVVGKQQTVEPDFGEFEKCIQYSGIRTETDAFIYRKSFWISVKSLYQQSHVLYNAETGEEFPSGYEVRWKINPAPLAAVTLKNNDFTFAKPSVNIVGESKSNLNNFDATFMEFDYSHSDPFTATAGEGSIRFKIKSALTNNFTFAQSTDESIDVHGSYMDINYNVKKGTFVPNSPIDNSKLKIEVSYYNNIVPSETRLIKTSSASVVDWTEDSWNYLIEQGLVKDNSTDGFYFSWNQEFNETFNAGNYEDLKLNYYHHNNNYHPIELEVDYTIKQAVMNFTTVNVVESELTDNKYTYDTLSAQVDFSSNFLNRLNLLSLYGMDINYILSYKEDPTLAPTNYTISSEEYTNSYFDCYMINAGSYSLQAEISCNGNYALSVDGGEQSNLAYVKYDFEIEKFVSDVLVKEVSNNLITDGYYELNDSNFYFKQGQSVKLSLTQWKESHANSYLLIYRLSQTDSLSGITTLVKNHSSQTYYRQTLTDDWQIAQNTTDIGYYKEVYSFTPVSNNITLKDCEYAWQIHSNVINFESNNLVWEEREFNRYNAKEYRSSVITNLPDNLFKVKYYNHVYDGVIDENPTQAINAGMYVSRMRVLIPNDGSVTFTYPSGMFTTQQNGNIIEYCYSKQTFWAISEYYLNPIEFEYKLVKDTFIYDDKVSHKIEYKLNFYDESEFDHQLLAFLNRAVFIKEYDEKPKGSYVARLQLPVPTDDDNFDYNYTEFEKAGYIYDKTNNILFFDLPWQIIAG